MKDKMLHEVDFSKIEIRPVPNKEGKFTMDLNPAGVHMTMTISAEDEESALGKGKNILKKQVERTGHQVIEGKK